MAIDVQSRKYLKEAKILYRNKDFDGALVHLSNAYSLGSLDAVKSLRNIIKMKRFKKLKPRDSEKNVFFIFDYFEIVRGQKFKKLSRIADTLYYGFYFEDKIFEKYRNSFKFYKGSWRVNKDYYSLYSMGKWKKINNFLSGYMQENGKGITSNSTGATEKFYRVMNASIHGVIPKISLIPSTFGFVKIYAKKIFKRVMDDGRKIVNFLKIQELL